MGTVCDVRWPFGVPGDPLFISPSSSSRLGPTTASSTVARFVPHQGGGGTAGDSKLGSIAAICPTDRPIRHGKGARARVWTRQKILDFRVVSQRYIMYDRVLGTVPNHILAGVVVLSDMLFAHTNSTFEDWPQADHPHHEAKWSRKGIKMLVNILRRR